MTAPDELGQTDRAEHFADKTNCRQQPAALGNPCHIQIDDAVEYDDYSEGCKDLWVILRRQPSIAKLPLRICYGIQSPRNVIDTRGAKDEAVELSSFDHFSSRQRKQVTNATYMATDDAWSSKLSLWARSTRKLKLGL